MKRILLCCGNGIATSTIMNLKLTKELSDRGREGDFEISQCLASEAAELSGNYDICVSSIPISAEFQCPFVDATGIVLGRGTKQIYDQIEDVLWPK